MKFALFYEIPVARPWTRDAEYQAYQNTLEQAVFGDRMDKISHAQTMQTIELMGKYVIPEFERA